MYNYWGFGLNITSEIEFPEMYPSTFDQTDVRISIGFLTPEVKQKVFASINTVKVANDTEVLFEVKGIGIYHALNGSQIFIEMDPLNTNMRNIRLFALASAMAAILLQRKKLPFHASAILTDGYLSLITGDSGAGKSTSVAGLVKKGHKIFTDDVIVLNDRSDEHITGTASYPMIKLWNETVLKLNHVMFNDKSFEVKPGIDKYGIFFHSIFDTKSYPIKNIFILKKGEASLSKRELNGSEAFSEVSAQIYRKGLIRTAELKKMSFRILAALLQNCKVYEITRPINGDIEQTLLKLEESL